MNTRSNKRRGQRQPKVTATFGPVEIPSASGPIIDLTRDSPGNDLLPTQLVGSSGTRLGRNRRVGSIVVLDEVIDLSTTPTKGEKEKRKIEETPPSTPTKRAALSPVSPACPICLEKLEFVEPLPERQVMTTRCGHMYCKGCIVPILKQNDHCPKCRRKQTVKDIIPLYS